MYNFYLFKVTVTLKFLNLWNQNLIEQDNLNIQIRGNLKRYNNTISAEI